jgi:eukaryotic-like serine/threonine-protein kinase
VIDEKPALPIKPAPGAGQGPDPASNASVPVVIGQAVEPSPAIAPQPAPMGAFARVLPATLGRYTLHRQLGTGGMAEVFLATYAAPGGFEKQVVVKVLLPHLAQDPKYVTLFQREAAIAARLRHPNLVQVLEFANDGGVPYIVMEYIDGIPLNRLARRAWAHKKSVPLELCVTAIADAALGLAYAHRDGLVHRDISPDNLMITKQGITMVLDFGIAKASDSESVTKTGEVKGKIPFMAPEMIRGAAPTPLVDLYALGVTLYWLVSGQRPFRGNEIATLNAALTQEPPSPRSINPSLPWKLDALIMAMLVKDPAQRIQSMDEVHAALDFASFARQKVVVPFVHEMLALPDDGGVPDGPTTDGFLPSQPALDLSKAMELTALDLPIRSAPDASPLGALVQAETAITTQHPAPVLSTLRRIPRAAIAAAALAGVAIAATFAFSGRDEKEPVRADPPPVVVVAPPTPTPTPPDVTTPPLPVTPTPVPVATEPTPTPPTRAAAKSQRVELRGPGHVQWLSGKSTLGTGSLNANVDARARTVFALDTKRGGRSEVRIQNGVADYASVPRGKLQIRAFPFAEVFVGKERIGNTPFPDVPLTAGTYTVTLKYEKRVETRKVTIRGQQTERITVRFE